MQGLLRVSRNKRMNEERNNSNDKRRKSKKKEKKIRCGVLEQNNQILAEQSSYKNKQHFEEIPINQEFENENRAGTQKTNFKINYFKKISRNILEYFLRFFSISDCFKLLKSNKKIRNLILTKHKFFPLFIQFKEIETVTYAKLFTCKPDKIPDCSELDEYISVVIGDKLNERETEIFLQEFLIFTIKEKNISCTVVNNNLMKYFVILFSHPNCHISHFQINIGGQNIYSELALIISSNKSIKSLIIDNFKFSVENVIKIKSAIEQNTTLKCLHIGSEFYNDRIQDLKTNDASLKLLIDIFSKNSSVDELELRYFGIEREASIILSHFIKANKTMKSLAFNCCRFGNISDVFEDCFRQNDTLESISFAGSHLSRRMFINLVKDLTFKRKTNKKISSSVVSNLKNISFSKCPMNLIEFESVIKIVEENINIVSLDISCNTMSTSKFRLIISMIENNKRLKRLNLSKSGLEASHFRKICKSLMVNNTLESINLKSNRCACSRSQVEELFEINKSLKEFLISMNLFDPEIENFINSLIMARE